MLTGPRLPHLCIFNLLATKTWINMSVIQHEAGSSHLVHYSFIFFYYNLLMSLVVLCVSEMSELPICQFLF